MELSLKLLFPETMAARVFAVARTIFIDSTALGAPMGIAVGYGKPNVSRHSLQIQE
jgi:hypothetical protein